jgi:hypothetical protein
MKQDLFKNTQQDPTHARARFVVAATLVAAASSLLAGLAAAQSTSPTPPDMATATANVYMAISFVVGAATAAIIFLAVKWIVSLFRRGGEA